MTHDDELIEKVAEVYWCVGVAQPNKWRAIAESDPITADLVRKVAALIVDAVRAYDAERRASVLDVAAVQPKNGTVWSSNDDGTWTQVTVAGSVQPDGRVTFDFKPPTHDPDDYRNLPVAMTGPVRFKGGLTEGKP